MTCCAPKSDEEKEKFCPNYKHKIITEKFYARHDQFEVNPERLQFYFRELERRQEIDLRAHFSLPITENQVYGWLEKAAFRFSDEQDQKILWHPKRVDDVMRTLQKISTDINRNRVTGVGVKK